MAGNIIVVAEHGEGGVRSTSREVFTLAQELASATGGEWAAVVIGSVEDAVVGSPRVLHVPRPAGRDPDTCAAAAAHAAEVFGTGIILLAATATGKDVAARLAAMLGVALAQDCTGCRISEDTILLTRAPYGGKVNVEMQMLTDPWVATVRPRSFAPLAGSRAAVVETMDAALPAPMLQVRSEAMSKDLDLDVSEAGIVVSGGRGMQGPEHWGILKELVDALGPRATLACSRPVSDAGWRPRSEHVGQTGRTISPDLYIACGISGAVQHVAGIASSKWIVAINRDPAAPIFRVADYGIVGDLFEVVPALTRQLRGSQ